jgi:hypothetical protein
MLASDIRGADYRAKAQQSLAHADSSTLLEVRRKHQAAASAWFELAAFEDRRSAHAREMMANARPRPVPALIFQPAEPFTCQS